MSSLLQCCVKMALNDAQLNLGRRCQFHGNVTISRNHLDRNPRIRGGSCYVHGRKKGISMWQRFTWIQETQRLRGSPLIHFQFSNSRSIIVDLRKWI